MVIGKSVVGLDGLGPVSCREWVGSEPSSGRNCPVGARRLACERASRLAREAAPGAVVSIRARVRAGDDSTRSATACQSAANFDPRSACNIDPFFFGFFNH